VTLFLALILSVVATWIWIRVARRLRLLDAPNPLVPQHRAPTAHMGGVAVASSAIIALALSSGGRGSDDGVVIAVLVGGVGFLLLGVMDDLLRLSARWKFAGQLVVASAAVVGGVVHPFFAIPWLDGAIAVLLIVTVVNAVNLTDVCDGLVAGLIAVTLGIASLQHPTLQGWAMATSGACLGFLVFNAPPARVFLGDAGSHWLGFMLIAVALTMSSQGTPLLEATRIALLCGVFLFELTLLVVARSARGVPFWLGSQDHFSLRLQALGLSRWATVALAWSVAAVLTSLAIVLARMSGAAQVWTLATLVLVAAVAFMALLKSWSPPPAPASSRPEPPRLVWIHQNFYTARQAGNSRAVHLVAAILEQGLNVDVVTT